MVHVLFVIDPIDELNIKKDSTIAMMQAAERRNWEVFTTQPKNLCWNGTDVVAFVQRTYLNPDFLESLDPSAVDVEQWYRIDEEQQLQLSVFDAIFMRKDPPFDMNYIYATYMLDHAESAGALVINKPQSLRDCNEKFYATEFPQFTPSMVVSQRADVLRKFHVEHRDVVYKKLDGMGGTSIFRMREDDPNLNVVIETLTNNETVPVMAQQFLPEIVDGDKRILIVDGKPMPFALARIPKKGETRGNLAVGGVGKAQPLSAHDKLIANSMGPALVQRGLLFVGIDVIGNYLTEVNVTCPTCIREIDTACGTDIAGTLMDSVAARIM